GRFSLYIPGEKISEIFGLDEVLRMEPRYNVAPTQLVLTIVEDRGRKPQVVQWGLVPPWAKDPSMASRMINARSETVAEKPAYRAAFHRRRCLLPANNFFAWKKEGGKSLPWCFKRRHDKIIAFAGIWEMWEREGHVIASCSILTTDANDLVKPIHHRMPLILHEDNWDRWLNPETNHLPATALKKELGPLMQAYPADDMTAYRVSEYVNSIHHDDPACLEPAEMEMF
ncbi:MAG: SOS response-associated peptidase, partial [Candidatus Sumerlaeota bacterium]